MNEVLHFRLGGEGFGLPVAFVREILGLLPILRVPEAPAAILGVANVRGEAVPILDLRAILGMEPGAAGPQAGLMVVRASVDGEPRLLGILADSVEEVVSAEPDKVGPPPKLNGPRKDYVTGVLHAPFLMILDPDRLELAFSA